MNAPGRRLRPILSEHVIFYTYRWLAWGLAGWAVFVLDIVPSGTVLALWLFMLTGFLNIIATALAKPYVRIARQRPLLLLCDILLSVLLVWAGGGTALPFLPYALGSLVLPGLLLNWYHALSSGLLFVALDLLAMAEQNVSTILLLRAGTTIGFLLICLLTRLLIQWENTRPGSPGIGSTHARLRSPGATPPHPDTSSDTGRILSTAQSRLKKQLPTASPVATMQAAPQATAPGLPRATRQRNQDAQSRSDPQPLNPYPGPEVGLTTALQNLASAFNRENDVDLQLELAESTQPISHAKQIALLKLAHEALQNIQQHAHAHSAWLTLDFETHTVKLIIQDDGVGLLDGTYQRPGLHALRAIRYRLIEMDGQLDVFEGAAGGVVVRGILPLGNP